MRRLISLVAVALVMAAMVLASVMPAFAAKPPYPPSPPNEALYHPGQYYCYYYDPYTGYYDEEYNIPRGQVATYVDEGWYCWEQG